MGREKAREEGCGLGAHVSRDTWVGTAGRSQEKGSDARQVQAGQREPGQDRCGRAVTAGLPASGPVKPGADAPWPCPREGGCQAERPQQEPAGGRELVPRGQSILDSRRD